MKRTEQEEVRRFIRHYNAARKHQRVREIVFRDVLRQIRMDREALTVRSGGEDARNR